MSVRERIDPAEAPPPPHPYKVSAFRAGSANQLADWNLQILADIYSSINALKLS
jgi:hypothetical protein